MNSHAGFFFLFFFFPPLPDQGIMIDGAWMVNDGKWWITVFTDAHSVPALGVGGADWFLLRLLAGETRTEGGHHKNHLIKNGNDSFSMRLVFNPIRTGSHAIRAISFDWQWKVWTELMDRNERWRRGWPNLKRLRCWRIADAAHSWSCCRTSGRACDWRRSSWMKRSGNATSGCRGGRTKPDRSADWSSRAGGRRWWTDAASPVAGPDGWGWRSPRGTILNCWRTLAVGARRSWGRPGHSWPCRWWQPSTLDPSGTAPGTCSTASVTLRWFRWSIPSSSASINASINHNCAALFICTSIIISIHFDFFFSLLFRLVWECWPWNRLPGGRAGRKWPNCPDRGCCCIRRRSRALGVGGRITDAFDACAFDRILILNFSYCSSSRSLFFKTEFEFEIDFVGFVLWLETSVSPECKSRASGEGGSEEGDGKEGVVYHIWKTQWLYYWQRRELGNVVNESMQRIFQRRWNGCLNEIKCGNEIGVTIGLTVVKRYPAAWIRN